MADIISHLMLNRCLTGNISSPKRQQTIFKRWHFSIFKRWHSCRMRTWRFCCWSSTSSTCLESQNQRFLSPPAPVKNYKYILQWGSDYLVFEWSKVVQWLIGPVFEYRRAKLRKKVFKFVTKNRVIDPSQLFTYRSCWPSWKDRGNIWTYSIESVNDSI